MRTRLTALLIAATALTLIAPSTVAATTQDTALADVVVALRGPVSSGGMTTARLTKLRAAIRSQARALGVTPLETYTTTRAFSARVSAQERDQLQGDARVLGVMDDDLIDGAPALEDSDSRITGRPVREDLRRQVTPTWLRRIGVTAQGSAAGQRQAPARLRRRHRDHRQRHQPQPPGRTTGGRQGLHPQRRLGRWLRPRPGCREHPGRPGQPSGHRRHPAGRPAVVGPHLRPHRPGEDVMGALWPGLGGQQARPTRPAQAVLRGRDTVVLDRRRQPSSRPRRRLRTTPARPHPPGDLSHRAPGHHPRGGRRQLRPGGGQAAAGRVPAGHHGLGHG